jgi:fimbrial chaperone protein
MVHALRTALHFTALIALATAAPAVAGTFSISPIRVELSAQQRTEALTVRNEESKEVVVQAQAMTWTQSDGHDVLNETHDVIVTPPVFTLAANSQQIVRVAVRAAPDAKRELNYRLILQEVPQAAAKNFAGLQVALRLSLPIFVAAQSKSSPDLTWASSWQTDGSLQITAKNQGTAHAQIIDFTVLPKDAPAASATMRNSVVKYVLPGATVTWSLQPPADPQQATSLKQSALTLHGASDQGEISADLSAAGR